MVQPRKMTGFKNAEGKLGNTCEFSSVLCELTGMEKKTNTARPPHTLHSVSWYSSDWFS
jgi:hypothetical protein